MPIIRVEMFPGRTVEQKREMVAALTAAFVRTAGGKPDSVYIVIDEVAKQHWGAGGQLCADKFPDKAPSDE